MAKIGAPVSPGTPRSKDVGGIGKAPAAPAPPPASAPAPPPAPAPARGQVNAQLVAQQFASAFVSAGLLAGQLVKGLFPGGAPQARRPDKPAAERPSAQRTEKARSEPQSTEAEHGPSEAGEGGGGGVSAALSSAFGTLRRLKLFRFRKAVKKGSQGALEVVSHIVLPDDYGERERDPQRALRYLGDEQEETSFDLARREAFLLQEMERRGAPPGRLARHLGSQLGPPRDREFKHLLAELVRPQMDSLADRLGEVSPDERRSLASLLSRSAHQVTGRSAESFAKLLTSAGAAEAAQLAESSEEPMARAARLTGSLRRAASPWYRSGLIAAARVDLKRLAEDSVGLVPEKQHSTWVWLLRAAEGLEVDTLPLMAQPLVAGMMVKGDAGAGRLVEVLGRALRRAPGGGSLVVHLIVTLTVRGDTKAATQLAGALREVLRQARESCTPAFASPDQLEERAALLVSLIPACSQVLEQGQGLPPDSNPLLMEALLAEGTLNIVGATAAGQQLLRRTLLAQERGAETFLSTLPRAALTLAQPKLAPHLAEAGLTPARFNFGGRPFLEGVAMQTGRAVVGPLLARKHKGDVAAAKALLRSLVRKNAALFGLTPDGSYLAADALEALRERPEPAAIKRTLLRLGKIRKKYSLGQFPGSTEPFQPLISALARSEGDGTPRNGPTEVVP
jgi:hypothetical protein